MNLEISKRFSKNTQTSNFMKIRPVEDELFHAADRDFRKLTVAFRIFANAPNNNNITKHIQQRGDNLLSK
jgi:hypothetical protein